MRDEGGGVRDEIKAFVFTSSLIPHPSSLSFLEEGVGVEPTGVFRLRRFSGPLGVARAQPSRVKSAIVKNDEGRELAAPEDTLRRTLLPRMARPSGLSQSTRGRAIQRRHPCPHLSLHRYFSYQTTKRSGRLQQGSSLPAPTILLNFLRRFGSGSRSR